MMKALPMLRGFTNNFREEYSEVNLERLNQFAQGSNVTPQTLREAGILKGREQRLKILGGGTLKVPMTVSAHRFSKTARAAIQAAGGSVEEI